jgi:imidazolonepropionase
MKILIKNIKKLVQVEQDKPKAFVAGADMSKLEIIDNAFLLINNDKIEDFGSMNSLPDLKELDQLKEIDVNGRMVFPSFCDSHTHIVYAGSREIEYIDKIKGLSYEEIAKRGGGILNSVKLLHNTSEDDLYEQSLQRINEMRKRQIKSSSWDKKTKDDGKIGFN